MILKIYLAVLLICFLSSLNAFRLDFPLRLKVLSVLMGITFCNETLCSVLTGPLHIRNNMPFYNVFSLLETLTFAVYFYLLLGKGWARVAIVVFFIAFPLWWGYTTFFLFGLHNWNSYVNIGETLLCLVMGVRYFVVVFTADELTTLHDNPDFWIVVGLLLYFTVQLPFGGMLNFMNGHLLRLAKAFADKYQLLNILLYTIFTYAFLCKRKSG
ncbi:hypothetical protein [Dinghuibacter silviterrae]|uniref:Uncharacterized protein n=1 Tax=Dinghuibacter silviterrae TaxID=1539049 RepID=A0A4R8DWI1_9BACT|nr:hypothetical protein [Dinghuibacter silviterrae]TDX01865.1 hypothetical protein EDB95_2909 [Dinghuibacter silviterrae]